MRGLVSRELQSVGPRAEAQRRRAGDQSAALPREGLELEGARLLLGLEVDDAVSRERDAQEERLAATPPKKPRLVKSWLVNLRLVNREAARRGGRRPRLRAVPRAERNPAQVERAELDVEAVGLG